MDSPIETIPQPAFSLHAFMSEADARAWRATLGAGGWIFVPEDGSFCWLFPANFTPTPIMLHPLTKGKNGRLV